MEKTLLDLSREIQAISKSGLAFSKDPFDVERFKQLEEIAAELISKHSSYSKEFISTVFSAETGYVTPKLDVRAAIFKNEKLLMVRERDSNAWTLPGGYVDVNESLSIAAEREVLEESGLKVKSRKVAAIYDHRKHGYKAHLYHFYKIYMVCELAGGSIKANIETSEVAFFTKTETETIPLDPCRITRAHALRMFDHYLQPDLATDFD
jgi:ADP-ribose pyrophosphatase YjhB (NUDIX family)